MPLLMLDLDNTLVDRAAAYLRWANRFVARRGLPDSEVSWLVTTDGDGLTPKVTLAEQLRDRYGLTDIPTSDVIEELRHGLVDETNLDPAVPHNLAAARAAGWRPVVVTNGTVDQQERKLRKTGLDQLVDGWAISEAVGHRKPSPAIFHAAAESVGCNLDDAWMVGDSPEADIGGAARLALRSIWISRGRPWPADLEPPTHIANGIDQALRTVIESAHPPH